MGVSSFSGGVSLSLHAVPAFFWLLALVHSLAEFSPLRPGHSDLTEHQGYHWLRHWLVLALLTLGWVAIAWSPTGWNRLGLSSLRWPAVAVAGLVLAVHATIDLGARAAVSWSSRRRPGNRVAIAWGFVGSQTLHLLAIWLIAQIATLPAFSQFRPTDPGVVGPLSSPQPGYAYFAWVLMSSTYFRWAAAGVAGWVLFGGAILIRLALATPRLRPITGQGLPQPGRTGKSEPPAAPDVSAAQSSPASHAVSAAESSPASHAVSAAESSTSLAPTPSVPSASPTLPTPPTSPALPTSPTSPALPTSPTLPRSPRTTDAGEAEQIGVYVGLLERLLTLVFLVMGQVAAIGLLVAAKSIARYKELEDREFAEYYLVGTLLSFTLATVGFLVLQVIGLGTIPSIR